MGYEEIGFDHFALPTESLSIAQKEGNLHRNFMGYTPFNTQLNIALGVSAISDSWTAFVQTKRKFKIMKNTKAGIWLDSRAANIITLVTTK